MRYLCAMNQIQIIGAIMLKTGKRVEEVAQDNGYSKYTFYRVIRGETPRSPVYSLIAKIIERPESEIWPDLTEEEV